MPDCLAEPRFPSTDPRADVRQRFHDFIDAPDYPCVGAKTALSRGNIRFVAAGDLRSRACDMAIAHALQRFAATAEDSAMFVTCVVLFEDTPRLHERPFELALWRRLQAVHDIDAATHPWDPEVDHEPASPDFAFSVGGRGFFVIGLHPGASREARRFDCAALVFNLHSQFEQLRRQGRFDRISHIIGKRDRALCGSANPMLAQHGDCSDAPQYSGREVDADWHCPFHARQTGRADDS